MASGTPTAIESPKPAIVSPTVTALLLIKVLQFFIPASQMSVGAGRRNRGIRKTITAASHRIATAPSVATGYS